jgi:hypothetical protein
VYGLLAHAYARLLRLFGKPAKCWLPLVLQTHLLSNTFLPFGKLVISERQENRRVAASARLIRPTIVNRRDDDGDSAGP